MTATATPPPPVSAPLLTEPSPFTSDVNLDAYDEEQVRLMEERCILVDEEDRAYGEGSKKECEYRV